MQAVNFRVSLRMTTFVDIFIRRHGVSRFTVSVEQLNIIYMYA